ncbi:MAG: hypothetical protein WKF90_16635 [Pyrinomonadaceae bacterium]
MNKNVLGIDFRSAMMPVLERLNFYKNEIQKAETESESIKKKLIVLIEPKPIVELTREDATARVVEDVEGAWKLSGATEELNLIILDANEKKRLAK